MPNPIEKVVTIAAPLERVWAALTEPAAIAAWMDDDAAAIDLRAGGAYQFFGGATTGIVTAFKAPRSLTYTWRQAEWPAAWADSVVTWTLRRAGAGTRVQLTHTGFPN